jgi:hypothetical protein
MDRMRRFVEGTDRGQSTLFSSQPIANNACSLFVIVWPGFREAVVGNRIALDADRVLHNLGGTITVVAPGEGVLPL